MGGEEEDSTVVTRHATAASTGAEREERQHPTHAHTHTQYDPRRHFYFNNLIQ